MPDDFDAMGADEIPRAVPRWRVRLLLDTRVLLWAAGFPSGCRVKHWPGWKTKRRSCCTARLRSWEVAIKSGLGRDDFDVDPHLLHCGLRESGYTELPVTGAHTAAVDLLPRSTGIPSTAF